MSYTTPPHKKARIIRRSLNGGTEKTPMNTMATLPAEVPTNPPLEKKRIYKHISQSPPQSLMSQVNTKSPHWKNAQVSLVIYKRIRELQQNLIAYAATTQQQLLVLNEQSVNKVMKLNTDVNDLLKDFLSHYQLEAAKGSLHFQGVIDTNAQEEKQLEDRYARLLNRNIKEFEKKSALLMKTLGMDNESLKLAKDAVQNAVDGIESPENTICLTKQSISATCNQNGEILMQIQKEKPTVPLMERVVLADAIIGKMRSGILSNVAGGKGKGNEKSSYTKYVIEKHNILSKTFKVSVDNIKKWVSLRRKGFDIPSDKRGNKRKISDQRFLEVYNEVRERHRNEDSMYQQDVKAALQMAIMKTAQDRGLQSATSTEYVNNRTLKMYFDILRPFFILSDHPQSKATSKERAIKGQDLRMILTNLALIGSGLFGEVSHKDPKEENVYIKLSKKQSKKNETKHHNIWNYDVTGWNLISDSSCKDLVVVALEDKNIQIKARRPKNTITQVIKGGCLSNAAGGYGGDIFMYRYLAKDEEKGALKQKIYKLQLPFIGNNKLHFWQIKKNINRVR